VRIIVKSVTMKKILLSNELKRFIQIEKEILNRSELQVFVANAAEDIIETHRSESVDLIILQLDMNGTPAEKICSFLRSSNDLKKVSILIVCNNEKAELERVQKCKANGYVTKPILNEQLSNSVSRLLSIPDRQDYRVLLKVIVKSRIDSAPFFCSSSNISVSGMLIETDKDLENGDIISCSFFLPKSEQITTDAEIIRSMRNSDKSYHYGIRYMDLNPRHRADLERFIRKRVRNSDR
jgi:DNA-binding response OmpR family regulator